MGRLVLKQMNTQSDFQNNYRNRNTHNALIVPVVCSDSFFKQLRTACTKSNHNYRWEAERCPAHRSTTQLEQSPPQTTEWRTSKLPHCRGLHIPSGCRHRKTGWPLRVCQTNVLNQSWHTHCIYKKQNILIQIGWKGIIRHTQTHIFIAHPVSQAN